MRPCGWREGRWKIEIEVFRAGQLFEDRCTIGMYPFLRGDWIIFILLADLPIVH